MIESEGGMRMEEYIRMYAHDIAQIIEDCECIQESHESGYLKEQEKVTAYNEIVKLVRKRGME